MGETEQHPAGLPVVYRDVVREEWVDRNGHFNAGFYMVAFDTAVGPWFEYCGVDRDTAGQRSSGTFTAESHTLYLRELEPREPFVVTAQLLAFAGKKIHTFLRMHRSRQGDEVGELVATNEILSLYVDLSARRPIDLPSPAVADLERLLEQHETFGRPAQCGRVVGVDAPRPPR